MTEHDGLRLEERSNGSVAIDRDSPLRLVIAFGRIRGRILGGLWLMFISVMSLESFWMDMLDPGILHWAVVTIAIYSVNLETP